MLVMLNTAFSLEPIEKYFKPAINKIPYEGIEGVDYIYMINLDQRPEKFEPSKQDLGRFGIVPYRFSAVNGWELPFDIIKNLGIRYRKGMIKGVMGTYYQYPEDTTNIKYHDIAKHKTIEDDKRVYFSHCMGFGAVGIVLSHLSVLYDAYHSGYETIWVMEDDIEVKRNPHELSKFIHQLDAKLGHDNWDILFTDPNTKNQAGEYIPCAGFATRPDYISQNNPSLLRPISKQLSRIAARYGAYSMIVRRSGIEKILAFHHKHRVFLPYDMEFPMIN
jgi:GR25 family glycosyltransferase involved in LPS biosynthesis